MDIELALGLQGYDVALREPEPIVTDESTADQISKRENWHNKNRMALLLMKRTITETVRGSIPDTEYALEYLQSISEKYKESEKAESSVLMHSLVTMSFDGTGSIREYIMKQIDVATKLRNLQFEVGDQFLVHLVLNSLPAEYTQLKVTHNTQKDKWGLNELISICVQEESRLKAEKTGIVSKSVNLVSKPKWKPKKHQFKKNSGTASNKRASVAANAPAPAPPKAHKSYQAKCFFCRKPGHFKKDCQGFKNWMIKRGNHSLTLNSAFFIELNLVNIQPQSFWIDSGSPLHIVNSLQGLTRTRVPRSDED